jgi:predicted transcriptional regulator
MSKIAKGKVVGVRVDETQQKELQKLAEKAQVSQSTLIRVALRRFFREMENSEHPEEEIVK